MTTQAAIVTKFYDEVVRLKELCTQWTQQLKDREVDHCFSNEAASEKLKVIQTSVITTSNSLSHDYTHPHDQTTL